jgi:hypothetical protein
MFSFQRLSFLLVFSLWVLPVASPHKASAQSISVPSLGSDDPAPQGSGALQGSTSTGGSVADLVEKSPPVDNQGSFLGVDIDAFSEVDGAGAGFAEHKGAALSLGLSNGYTPTLDPDKQLRERLERSSTISQSVRESTEEGILPDTSTQPTEVGILPDTLTQPTEVSILPDTLTPSPQKGVPVNRSTQSTGKSTLPGNSTSAPPQLSQEVATVPEPSISLLAWLGLAAVGLFAKRRS